MLTSLPNCHQASTREFFFFLTFHFEPGLQYVNIKTLCITHQTRNHLLQCTQVIINSRKRLVNSSNLFHKIEPYQEITRTIPYPYPYAWNIQGNIRWHHRHHIDSIYNLWIKNVKGNIHHLLLPLITRSAPTFCHPNAVSSVLSASLFSDKHTKCKINWKMYL